MSRKTDGQRGDNKCQHLWLSLHLFFLFYCSSLIPPSATPWTHLPLLSLANRPLRRRMIDSVQRLTSTRKRNTRKSVSELTDTNCEHIHTRTLLIDKHDTSRWHLNDFLSGCVISSWWSPPTPPPFNHVLCNYETITRQWVVRRHTSFHHEENLKDGHLAAVTL